MHSFLRHLEFPVFNTTTVTAQTLTCQFSKHRQDLNDRKDSRWLEVPPEIDSLNISSTSCRQIRSRPMGRLNIAYDCCRSTSCDTLLRSRQRVDASCREGYPLVLVSVSALAIFGPFLCFLGLQSEATVLRELIRICI